MDNNNYLDLIKQDIKKWNKWRLENPKKRNLNFSGENLSGAILSGGNFRGIDFSSANLSGADLSGADLSEADLIDANLCDAKLNKAVLKSTELIDAKLCEADLSGANLSRADLSGTDLSGADLSDTDLSKVDLSGANLYGADLSGADLSGSDLGYTQLSESDLSGADLSGAEMHSAELSDADLTEANLNEALLIDADLIGARLCKADLSCANLKEACLNEADLSQANLRGVILSNAELIETNLTEADLTGANLKGVDLTDAEVKKACFGNNLGISHQIREELINRGAIFTTSEEVSFLEDTEGVSSETINILKQQIIDENQPGTILKDFQMLLDYIGENGIEVSGINSFFPMKLFSEINSRLTHPIFLDLKRPQQKSYPNIHGLYLLLRASGLTRIKREGKKAKLILDTIVLQSWNRLNSCERYFNLLEIWLIWASDETLGEHDRYCNFLRCLDFDRTISSKGIKITKKNQGMFVFNKTPGLHNLALLDIFGLYQVSSSKPEPGKGWRIGNIKKTVFGEAIFQFFSSFLFARDWHLWNKFSLQGDQKSFLHSKLQSYFSDWQNFLIIPKREFVEGIYIFKVKLHQAWRSFAIPSTLDLEFLVNSILQAFNFDKDHLYQFICKDRFGTILTISHPYMEDSPPWTDDYRVGELPLQVGETMTFRFDFGDNWQFNILLEEINSPDPKIKHPQLLKSSGNPPPQYWSEDWDEESE